VLGITPTAAVSSTQNYTGSDQGLRIITLITARPQLHSKLGLRLILTPLKTVEDGEECRDEHGQRDEEPGDVDEEPGDVEAMWTRNQAM